MSTWEDLRSTVNRWTNKVNTVAEEIADQTALQFKLTARRNDLEKEFTAFGKLAYQKLCPATDDTPDDLTEQINQSMTRISTLKAELDELEKRIK